MMERRTFLKTISGALYAAVAAVVGIPAFRFLTDPLRRKKLSDAFLRAASMDALAADRPIRVMLASDRWDAFVHHPPGPIGSVWLKPSAGGAPPRCLQVICPHLGCGIEYAPDRGAFYCPCHDSEFDLDGKRRFGPSPRDMDELPCRVTEPDEQGVRWIEVQYAKFQTGIADKKQVS